MDWKWFSNEITEEQAKKVARILGLKIGTTPSRPFGGNWGIKGLYAITSGKYKGEAYFGRGSGSRMVEHPQTYRPLLRLSESQKKDLKHSKKKDP